MSSASYEHVLEEIHQLTPEERRRLRDQLTVLVAGEATQPAPRRRSSYGALSHLGHAPSAAEIDEARRETWANFPRDVTDG